MKAFMNVTGKYADTSGRKPPSRHYNVDDNTQKIYTTLYPEPGVVNKVKVTFQDQATLL
jgi:hypothetical protein